MKYLALIPLFIALSFANNNGCAETGPAVNPQVADSDDITLTVVNNWTVDDQVIGIDIIEGSSVFCVNAVCNEEDLLRTYDAATGIPTGVTMPLAPANMYAWGVAWNNNSTTPAYYVNDFLKDDLYYHDGVSSWITVPDPAGTNSRGIDFDGIDYWETDGAGSLWRFQPGVSQESIAIPEVTEQISGLTVFPYGSNLGIAVTTYGINNIHFFQWNGSTMDFMACAACPASNVHTSLGLAYSETNEHMYWTYYDTSGNFHIAEFSFSITALERSSWGAIKSSF